MPFQAPRFPVFEKHARITLQAESNRTQKVTDFSLALSHLFSAWRQQMMFICWRHCGCMEDTMLIFSQNCIRVVRITATCLTWMTENCMRKVSTKHTRLTREWIFSVKVSGSLQSDKFSDMMIHEHKYLFIKTKKSRKKSNRCSIIIIVTWNSNASFLLSDINGLWAATGVTRTRHRMTTVQSDVEWHDTQWRIFFRMMHVLGYFSCKRALKVCLFLFCFFHSLTLIFISPHSYSSFKE